MPSHLRLQSSPLAGPIEAHATYNTLTQQPPAKKQRMSLTRTYAVASTARGKLSRQAAKADHDLRRLVGHANLLDQLMVELADAERESESWLNQSIREAEEPRRVQWMDQIVEDYEEEESDDESDDEGELEDSDLFSIPPRIKMAPVLISSDEVDMDDEEAVYDDMEEEEDLGLRRVASQHSPPELTLDDSDSEEEEEYTPQSPEDSIIQLSEKERQAITTTAFYDLKSQSEIEDFAIPQSQQPLIAAC